MASLIDGRREISANLDWAFGEVAAVVSPDRTRAAIAIDPFEEGGDHTIKILKLNGDELVEIAVLNGPSQAPRKMAFSPDGSLLAQVFRFNEREHGENAVRVQVSRLSDGAEVATLEIVPDDHPEATGMAFSPDGRLLAIALADGELQVWDSSSWTQLFAAERPSTSEYEYLESWPGSNSLLAFSPDGEVLAVGRRGGWVELWGVKEG